MEFRHGWLRVFKLCHQRSALLCLRFPVLTFFLDSPIKAETGSQPTSPAIPVTKNYTFPVTAAKVSGFILCPDLAPVHTSEPDTVARDSCVVLIG